MKPHRGKGHALRFPGRRACLDALTRLATLLFLCAVSVALLKLLTLYDAHMGGAADGGATTTATTSGDGADAEERRRIKAAAEARREAASKELWSAVAAAGDANDAMTASRLRLGLVVPQVISWHPRIFLYKSFLSIQECDELKAIAKRTLEKSTVVDSVTGKSVASEVRTSSGMFLSHSDKRLKLVKDIEERIALASNVPPENGELIQILRYEHKEHYLPHFDYFADEVNQKRGGQRVATMLMYIEAPESGGETIFPNAGGGAQCECAGVMQPGLCVKPGKGDAVLFWSMDFEGHIDQQSLHGSCDVLKGEKWSATKWMRQRTFT